MDINLEIITNNVPRHTLYAYELTERDLHCLGYDEKERQEAEENGESFVRYRGTIYPLGNFMRLDNNHPFGENWNGYHGETFFSGILIRILDDGEAVILGRYFS